MLEKRGLYIGTKQNEMVIADQTWREYNIHDNDGSNNKDDGEENEAMPMNLFAPDGEDDLLEEVEYIIPTTDPDIRSEDKILRLQSQEDYSQSTGMSIWRGSELLAEYLVRRRGHLVNQKRMLELGAGVGLCGLVAHRLGASRVIWTDGDETVLSNLRTNVAANLDLTNQNDCQTECDDVDGDLVKFFCPQLIWGKHLDSFLKIYGKSDIIIGTDLFYMTKSLDPLFQTVDRLLVESSTGDDDENGVFVAVNSCASQSPMDTILKVADRNGFVWETEKATLDSENVKEDEQVYLFRRKPRTVDD